MSQNNNEEKDFFDSGFFQFLIFVAAGIVWFIVKTLFGITDEEHFGFIGSVVIVFVIALALAVIAGTVIGLLEPHKEKIQKLILIAVIAFAVYVIGNIVINRSNTESSHQKNFQNSSKISNKS